MLTYLSYLPHITATDVAALNIAQLSYGDSWKKRGGTGAFMMLARKWDRIERQVEQFNHDIFEAVNKDTRDEGLIDDIRDLRRYLALVEGELMASYTIDRPDLPETSDPDDEIPF